MEDKNKKYAFIVDIANSAEYKKGVIHTEKLYLPTDFTTLSNTFRKIGLPPNARQGSYIFDDLHLYSEKLHNVITLTENIYDLNYLAMLISKMNDKQYDAFINEIEDNPKIKDISDLFDYAKSFYTFKAYIVNREEYDIANPYNGEWLYFPTDAETVKLALASIGLPENVSPDTYFFDDYTYKSGDNKPAFHKNASIDELNYLSVLLGGMSETERNTFDAVIEAKEHTANMASLINLAHNIECYNLVYDMYSWENVGAYIAEKQGFGVGVIGDLADYIDYEAYGKDYAERNRGYFLGDVYLERVSTDFEIKYNGEVKDIPLEYRIERAEKQITEKRGVKNMNDYIFKAFIVNRFEYDNGNKETSGAWLYFPTDAETVKRTLKEIGLPNNAKSNQYFFDDYQCGNDNLKKCLSIYEDIDELNYLASRISELEDNEMTVFQTVLEADGECDSVREAINITYNLEYYNVVPDIFDYTDLGEYYAEKNNLSAGDLDGFVSYERYGEEMESNEGGHLLNEVYLETGCTDFTKMYDGKIENIPSAYVVTDHGGERSKPVTDFEEKPPKNTYSLYQLKDGPELHYHRFERLDKLRNNGMAVERKNYDLVYSGVLKDTDTLDTLYERFNIDRPTDFKGHSMSVSDIIVLCQNGQNTAYYCDSVGFREVPEFLTEKENLLDAEESTIQANVQIDSQADNAEQSNTDTMTVLIVPPMQEPYTKEIGMGLKDLQREVGGNIQVLYPFAEEVGLICNEEGKNIGLDLNRALYDAGGEIYDIVAGTFVLAGLGAEDFISLPQEQIDVLSKQFKSPEVFVRVNGDIKAIPTKPSIKKELKQIAEKGQKQDRQQRKPPDVGLE